MSQIINTNLASLDAQRNLTMSQGSLATSMQRLSSGLRVNSAKDDAAGLAIADRMNTQVRGMTVAVRNANDGISMAQTAEGALGQMGDMLQRMRELAVQSANGTNNDTDRVALNNEFSQLQNEITRLAANTTFNGQKIINNAQGFQFQVGANATANDAITIPGVDVLTTTAGTTGTSTANDGALASVVDPTKLNILAATSGYVPTAAADYASNNGGGGPPALNGNNQGQAADAIQFLDYAIAQVDTARSMYGAAQNRFGAVISSLGVSVESQTSARSRIMDADYAAETANLSRSQILQQAGNSMVAQANQLPQQVLTLLRGG